MCWQKVDILNPGISDGANCDIDSTDLDCLQCSFDSNFVQRNLLPSYLACLDCLKCLFNFNFVQRNMMLHAYHG